MTLHFVKLVLGNKNYKSQFSTANCTYVDDFRGAIKNKYPHLLNSYDAAQLTLFQPDGSTEIDPETLVTDLAEIPWKPMVVTVDELPIPASIGSTKKQLTYKGMSTEASCRKYLDALAVEFSFEYDFPKTYKKPTMGNVLAARKGQFGKPKKEDKGIAWWDYKKENETSFTTEPLPTRLSDHQWEILNKLNYDTSNRIHDAVLPRTSNQKAFIVLPHTEYTKTEYVDALKSIAAIIGVVPTKDELVVKDESDLSGSSSSEASTSPDKEKKL